MTINGVHVFVLRLHLIMCLPSVCQVPFYKGEHIKFDVMPNQLPLTVDQDSVVILVIRDCYITYRWNHFIVHTLSVLLIRVSPLGFLTAMIYPNFLRRRGLRERLCCRYCAYLVERSLQFHAEMISLCLCNILCAVYLHHSLTHSLKSLKSLCITNRQFK